MLQPNGNIVWLVGLSDAFNEQQPNVPQSEVNGADSKSFTPAHVGKSDDGDGRNVTLRSVWSVASASLQK